MDVQKQNNCYTSFSTLYLLRLRVLYETPVLRLIQWGSGGEGGKDKNWHVYYAA
jgi:hypothetical protein